jgi:glycosyltransferase involved in cell wall biosynthesis
MQIAPRPLFLTGDETGSAMWRVWSVCKALQGHGFVAEWCHKDDAEKALPLIAAGVFDLVITPRIVWPQEGIGDRWIKAIHGAGLAWVYECDDDVWSQPIIQRQIKLFATEAQKGELQLEWERKERIRLINDCDGITVASTRLKSIIDNRFTDGRIPVVVVPNAIDVPWFRRTLRGCARLPELQGKLTIGWAGGTRQYADLAPLVAAWPRIAERYPDVHFVVQGHVPPEVVEVMPHDRLHTLPWLPLEEYPRAMLNVDIACCIVAPTVFNTAKTPIKWMEFTLAGAACVVSPTLYGAVVEDGETALVAESGEEWEMQLARLIESEHLRSSLQRAARIEVVSKHSLERNLVNWLAAWATIVESFRAKRSAPQLLLPR